MAQCSVGIFLDTTKNPTNKLKGFSTIRVASAALRIAWAYHNESVNLAIAAQIFVAAGTVILYIVNLFLSQRIMRARHPDIGWSKPFTLFMGPGVIGITFISLIMIIVTVIQTYFTLNANTHRIDHDILLFGTTEFAVASFIPVIVILITLAIPRRSYIDKFGNGKYKTKVGIALTGSILVALGSAYRAGTAWLPTALLSAPEKWYFSKACFYVFDYGLDIVVLYLYLISRVDKRFYVPDGAQGAGSYGGDVLADGVPPSWDFEAYMRSGGSDNFGGDETTLDDGRSTRASSYLEMDARSGKWNVKSLSHTTIADTLRGEGNPKVRKRICADDSLELPEDYEMQTRGTMQSRTSTLTTEGRAKDGHWNDRSAGPSRAGTYASEAGPSRL